MTIPSLHKNMEGRQNVAALKKVYSTLAAAVELSESYNGPIKYWKIVDGSDPGAETAVNYIKPYLNIIKDCKTSSGCYPSQTGKGPGTNVYGFVLADGTMVSVDLYSSVSTSFGINNKMTNYMAFWVDVNGEKPPNMLGVDQFIFVLTAEGVVPAGRDNESIYCTVSANRYDCAAKVLREQKIDF